MLNSVFVYSKFEINAHLPCHDPSPIMLPPLIELNRLARTIEGRSRAHARAFPSTRPTEGSRFFSATQFQRLQSTEPQADWTWIHLPLVNFLLKHDALWVAIGHFYSDAATGLVDRQWQYFLPSDPAHPQNFSSLDAFTKTVTALAWNAALTPQERESTLILTTELSERLANLQTSLDEHTPPPGAPLLAWLVGTASNEPPPRRKPSEPETLSHLDLRSLVAGPSPDRDQLLQHLSKAITFPSTDQFLPAPVSRLRQSSAFSRYRAALLAHASPVDVTQLGSTSHSLKDLVHKQPDLASLLARYSTWIRDLSPTVGQVLTVHDRHPPPDYTGRSSALVVCLSDRTDLREDDIVAISTAYQLACLHLTVGSAEDAQRAELLRAWGHEYQRLSGSLTNRWIRPIRDYFDIDSTSTGPTLTPRGFDDLTDFGVTPYRSGVTAAGELLELWSPSGTAAFESPENPRPSTIADLASQCWEKTRSLFVLTLLYGSEPETASEASDFLAKRTRLNAYISIQLDISHSRLALPDHCSPHTILWIRRLFLALFPSAFESGAIQGTASLECSTSTNLAIVTLRNPVTPDLPPSDPDLAQQVQRLRNARATRKISRMWGWHTPQVIALCCTNLNGRLLEFPSNPKPGDEAATRFTLTWPPLSDARDQYE